MLYINQELKPIKMGKLLRKLLGWEIVPIATGKITGISYTIIPDEIHTLNDFFINRSQLSSRN